MSYPAEHRSKQKRALVRVARDLFNRKGFDAVSIEEIMAGLGLTRGGFYNYFSSKSEIYALAVEAVLAGRPVSESGLAASEAARDLIRGYLSARQLDGAESSCSLVTLPSSVARRDAPVRRVFEPAFRRMVKVFEQCLEFEGRPDRDRAVLAATLCIGAMAIGRALDTPQLAGQVRGAALNYALALVEFPEGLLGTGPRGAAASSSATCEPPGRSDSRTGRDGGSKAGASPD